MSQPAVLRNIDARGVATVTLNRPAIDDAVLGRLCEQHAAKRRSAEAAEGLASFAEKRAASWFPAG